MKEFVNEINWVTCDAMKYWGFPASYSQEKKQAELNNAIFSKEYYGALKVDGYYQRFVKDEDGNCFMIARNKNVKKEPIDKIEWVPQLHDFMDSLPNGTVLLGEIFLPNNEGSSKVTKYLGCLKDKCIQRQNNNNEFLNAYIFDVCAYDGANLDKTPFIERIKILEQISNSYPHPFVTYATYYNGTKLWDKLQEYLHLGREGIVLMHQDCPIYFKRTPAHKSLKIKKELQETIDVVVMGAQPPTREYNGEHLDTWQYWENINTKEKFNTSKSLEFLLGEPYQPITKAYYYGWAGSVAIGAMKDGKCLHMGSLAGLPEEVLKNWKDYVGKVCEISAMEVLPTGGLRHPKFIQWRPDKQPSDTSWDLIFNNENFNL